MASKFNRGDRVEISRESNYNYAGLQAIVDKNADDTSLYRLLVLLDEKDNVEIDYWYDERYLELICCNTEKGKKKLSKIYGTEI